MQKKFQQSGFKTFKLKISSDTHVKITVSTSFDSETWVICDYSNENLLFSEHVNDGQFMLDIIDPEHEEKTRQFFKDLSEKNSFLDMAKAVFSIFANEKTYQKKIGTGGELNIAIRLAKDTENFVLNVNNGEVYIDNLSLKEFTAHTNNGNCRISNSTEIVETEIVANNSEIELPLNKVTQKAIIKANNGAILFNRSKEFDGEIRVKGNNTNVSGNLGGKNPDIEIKCKINNGKVTVLSL